MAGSDVIENIFNFMLSLNLYFLKSKSLTKL